MKSLKENTRALMLLVLGCAITVVGAGLSMVPALATTGLIIFFAGLLFLVVIAIIGTLGMY